MKQSTTSQGGLVPRRRVASWVILWFVALMMLTVAVRVLDPTGWLGSDDAFYHSAAEYLLAGEQIQRMHHHYTRTAVILPIAASIWAFGASPAAVALPTMIASILCVLLVAILGRLVWGWWEGLCAATVVSVLPYFRVLSTTSYADVHSCLWVTLAVVLALAASRAGWTRWVWGLGIACGFAIGLGASAKIFSITAIIPVAVILWVRKDECAPSRTVRFSAVALGGLLVFLAEGLFHLWAAGDFLYRYHVLADTQATDAYFTLTGTSPAAAYATAAWERITLLFRAPTSGWGELALAFWPAACVVMFFSARGRSVAVWAIGAYLLIALAPVRLKGGPHPYPFFDGRHALTTCIPFALCTAWMLRRLAAALLRAGVVQQGWPVALVTIAGLAYANPRELNGFRQRPTSRVGQAIEQIVANTDWDDQREIFMPASLYLRYRVLFPEELRPRLRVAVDEKAPTWWRQAGCDIASRCRPLPHPDEAYLIASPVQLRGQAEFWDYGVGLPREGLDLWWEAAPLLGIGRLEDKHIGVITPDREDVEPLLLLVGDDPNATRKLAKRLS